ncbi:hypothetical protein RSOLAG1IB_05629 [Rhizoctonia solani AG-1 IB]|uniref:Uncharacterized protein n=1 Tax=Thanatephorus cucumeris (strain AG1-IB / isolate 7/3/14) TaxID=1108050 RepID=A0A0B7G1L7_THACB|nr:hypothetical protein RSOLAG1IB_05629 [Rhizoctonia solani AG-1 IB]
MCTSALACTYTALEQITLPVASSPVQPFALLWATTLYDARLQLHTVNTYRARRGDPCYSEHSARFISTLGCLGA